ncbi:serine/threonine-protein kinase H1-like [Dunckerocampus dactyliophorus]|uniref:serine/threonine-protein kinase H1-like n=1 Tax=Dunckerocampus dactyliophorus TaxID=161453 RepID=UPI002405D894|nr:serine/threonine-protein kinase H1-like [Dunckerocampus dactyliophorus]
MGCGSGKALPKGYVSIVQSLVAFSRAPRDRPGGDEDPKKTVEKGHWFSAKGKKLPSERRQPVNSETYKDTFDARLTARYDIKALIGRGSFSRVVRAEHRASRRPFAIKLMEVEAPQAREVCAAELAVLRRVNHDNVIRLVEVFQGQRRVYMVLELATGGELLDRVVSRGHYTEQDATRALQMVLAGVGYLHSLGITHRDLKPENVLYYHPGADSRLLVTDFGLATFSGSEAPCGTGGSSTWSLRTTCGTPEYMAPEVVLRRPYSCAVDMWALGVIAYIVLSGSMPFEDDSRSRLYRSILRGKCSFHGEPWPSVSKLAKDFIRGLLEPDPARRPTADQALRHSWVVTMASSSSMKNLHRSISQNLRQRASRNSSRCQSRTTNGSARVGVKWAERQMSLVFGVSAGLCFVVSPVWIKQNIPLSQALLQAPGSCSANICCWKEGRKEGGELTPLHSLNAFFIEDAEKVQRLINLPVFEAGCQAAPESQLLDECVHAWRSLVWKNLDELCRKSPQKLF